MSRPVLPVLRAVGAAYAFGFKNFFTLMRIGWLPAVIYGAMIFGQQAFLPGTPEGDTPEDLLGLGLIFGSFLPTAVLSIGFMRVYFRDTLSGGPAYFKLGPSELRFFAAYVFAFSWIFVVIAVVAFGALLFLEWLALLTDTTMPDMDLLFDDPWSVLAEMPNYAYPLLAIVGIFVVLFAIAMLIRLVLVAPIILKERKTGLIRARSMARSNLWGLLVGQALVVVPTYLFVFLVAEMLEAIGIISSGEAVFIGDMGPIESFTLPLILEGTLGPAILLLVSMMFFTGFAGKAYDTLAGYSVHTDKNINEVSDEKDNLIGPRLPESASSAVPLAGL